VAIDERSYGVLVDAHRQKTPVFISGDGTDVTFQTFLLHVEEDSLLVENRIKPEYISAFCRSKSFSLLVSMVRFQSQQISTDGQHILFPLKKDSVIEETRGSERFAFSSEEHVICEVLNPFDGETRLSKSVMDMSATGLSIRTTFESELFQPSTFLPDLRVLIDGEPYTQSAGRVVYKRKMLDLSGGLRLQVGIKLEKP